MLSIGLLCVLIEDLVKLYCFWSSLHAINLFLVPVPLFFNSLLLVGRQILFVCCLGRDHEILVIRLLGLHGNPLIL